MTENKKKNKALALFAIGLSALFVLGAFNPLFVAKADDAKQEMLMVKGQNIPPNTPTDPAPANNQMNVGVDIGLRWTGGDQNHLDHVRYRVYFGTTSPPPYYTTTAVYPATETRIYFGIHLLGYSIQYYWKIVATDDYGVSTFGPIWTFTTQRYNEPPYIPSNPSPANNSFGVDPDTVLSWSGGDPDAGDTVIYQILFDTVNPPMNCISPGGTTSTTFDLGTLQYYTMYYWKVYAYDDLGAWTVSPVWRFLSQGPNSPPYIPSNPSPVDGAIRVDPTAYLSWIGGDPNGDIVTYDVYFGSVDPLPKVSSNQSATTYDPPQTLFDTVTYHWKIVAWDHHGASTQGPEWAFTVQMNRPPCIPSFPYPQNNSWIDVHSTYIPGKIILSWMCGDPDLVDTVTYDVYFGCGFIECGTMRIWMGLVSNDQVANYYVRTLFTVADIPMDYYWRIIATDNHGASTIGPLWHFKTGHPVMHMI